MVSIYIYIYIYKTNNRPFLRNYNILAMVSILQFLEKVRLWGYRNRKLGKSCGEPVRFDPKTRSP